MSILEFAEEFRRLAEEPMSWDSFVIRCSRSEILIYDDELDERKSSNSVDKLHALLEKMDWHPAHGGVYFSEKELVDEFPYIEDDEEQALCRASSDIF